jgi:hypothetical protein
MITLTDDRLDLEIVAFLGDEAEDLYGAPDAHGMAWRIGSADSSPRRRIERVLARPIMRVAIVGMLLAGVVGAAVLIGASRTGPFRNGLIIRDPLNAVDPATGAYGNNPFCTGPCADDLDVDPAFGSFIGPVAWSRDARQMAIVDTNGLEGKLQTGHRGWSIWRYDFRSGTVELVTECGQDVTPQAERWCGAVAFSVDGESLAYIESGPTPTGANPALWERLVVIDLATGSRRVVDRLPGIPHQGMSFVADGRVLLGVLPSNIAPEQTEAVRNFLIDPETGAVVEPVIRWPHSFAGVSPDGTQIAYLAYEEPMVRDGFARTVYENPAEVWLASIDGSRLRRVYRAPGVSVDHPPVWSPDGTRLALDQIGVLDIATGEVSALPPGPLTAWLPAP